MTHVNEKKLAPTRRTLPMSLLRVRELIMEPVRPMLLNHNITEQQWRVLRVVSEEKEADATTVADKACLLAPSLTRILKTLSEKQYIEVFKDKNDGRRTMMRLTKEGQDFIDKVTPESLAIFEELRSIVGDERWENLIELLLEIRDDFKKAKLENQ